MMIVQQSNTNDAKPIIVLSDVFIELDRTGWLNQGHVSLLAGSTMIGSYSARTGSNYIAFV